jgi:hypothetical protein
LLGGVFPDVLAGFHQADVRAAHVVEVGVGYS